MLIGLQLLEYFDKSLIDGDIVGVKVIVVRIGTVVLWARQSTQWQEGQRGLYELRELQPSQDHRSRGRLRGHVCCTE